MINGSSYDKCECSCKMVFMSAKQIQTTKFAEEENPFKKKAHLSKICEDYFQDKLTLST